MRILFSTHKFAFQHPGGGEVIILKSKEYLEKLGHTVDLFNPWIHKVRDYDIIHEFSLLDWQNWNTFIDSNIPFVLTPTSWPNINYTTRKIVQIKSNIKKSYNNLRIPNTLYHKMKYPNLILPTTNLEKERIKSHYNITDDLKFKVVNNGIDIIDIEKIDLKLFNDKYGSTPYLLYVGSISRNKNTEVAIKIANELRIKLFIIGEQLAGNTSYFQKCKSYESDNIIFLGRLEHNSPMLISAMANASCLLVPSDFETCSLVGLEAMSIGTPICITEFGGTKEIFKNHATYINPSSMESCVKNIKICLSKDKSSAKLKSFIDENYSWEKIASKLSSIYRELKHIC